MADTIINSELTQRSFIASVLYIEVADYADRPVFEQIQLTTLMRQLIDAQTIQIDDSNWFLIDREESLVLLFSGEPHPCFVAARHLKDALENNDAYRDAPLHIGVNLGPVSVVKGDLNQLHVSGPGVDDAAQIAHGGELREILISRAYYAVLARVSKDYGLLQYKAFVSDERDETIAVYRIADGSSPQKAEQLEGYASITTTPRSSTTSRIRRWSYAALPVALIAAAGMASYQLQRSDHAAIALAPKRDAALIQSVHHATPEPTPTVQAEPVAIAEVRAVTSQIATLHAAEPAEGVAETVQEISTSSAASQPEALVPTTTALDPAQTAARPLSPKPGTLRLAIRPWGEVYVDGKRIGVTPPLRKITLKPGKRKIVVRNAHFLPYSAIIDIKSESYLHIAHHFDQSKPKE